MCSPLLLSVQRAVCAKDIGVRVTQDASNGDIFVHDCPAWAPHNAARLLESRPNAVVTIIGSAASLSGFVISIREPPEVVARSRAHRLAIALALAVSAAAVGAMWRFWPEIVAAWLAAAKVVVVKAGEL